MNPELTELEILLIVHALKIWRGDFPKDDLDIPSKVWEEELTMLITGLWDKL